MKILIRNAKNIQQINFAMELLKQNCSKIIISLKYIFFMTSLLFEMNFFSKRTVNFFHREETIGKSQEHIWD